MNIPAVYYKYPNGAESGHNTVPDVRYAIKSNQITAETPVYAKGVFGGQRNPLSAGVFLRRYGPKFDSQMRMGYGLLIGILAIIAALFIWPNLIDHIKVPIFGY